MAAGGANDRLAALSDYAKTLPGIYQQGTKDRLGVIDSSGKLINSTFDTGARGVASAFGQLGSAGNAATVAAGAGPKVGDYASLINALKPGKEAAVKGVVGPTAGGTYNSADDVSGSGDGTPTIGGWDHRYNFGATTKGAGGEAARFGGEPAFSVEDRAAYDPWGYSIPTPNYSSPFSSGSAYISVPDQYQTPWSF
jgi:hypothetical protein